jgi:hypothetical protein
MISRTHTCESLCVSDPLMLERLYHHMIGHPGVRFVTMNEMADDFARRSPRKR